VTEDRRVRVTALVESLEHVCCRYRAAAFQPFLAQAGYRLELRPLPRRPWHRLGLPPPPPDADAAGLQRKPLAPCHLYPLPPPAPVARARPPPRLRPRRFPARLARAPRPAQ